MLSEVTRPPKLGGQRDRDAVEIARGEVPNPHPWKVCLGTSPRATLSGRAALLAQEGVPSWMKKVTLPLKWLIMLLACIVLTACAESRDNAGQPPRQTVALFTKNQLNPYFQTVRVAAQTAAKELDVDLVNYIPTVADSIPEQMSQIEDAITKRPNAAVFIPVDAKAMIPGIEKFNAAGIPVVNLIDRSEGGEFISFMGCDDYAVARETARYLLQKMNGKGNVVIIEGVGGSSNNQKRVAGFKKALEEFPNVKLLASQPANFQRAMALQVTENLLQAHRQVDGILAANDAMALGAIEALDAANRKALVVGMNGTKEAVDAVKAGKLLATGDCDGFLQGCMGMMGAVRHLRNLPVPKEVVFPIKVFDITNYQGADVPYESRMCPKWESVVKE
jgi:ribose transport system substrate-binding protein